MSELGMAILGVLAAILFFRIFIWRLKRRGLFKKYTDPKIVEQLMNQVIWVGETADQLLDSLGRPLDIDEKVSKTRVKRIWKYKRTGSNRFGVKITVEDDIVIGWDVK